MIIMKGVKGYSLVSLLQLCHRNFWNRTLKTFISINFFCHLEKLVGLILLYVCRFLWVTRYCSKTAILCTIFLWSINQGSHRGHMSLHSCKVGILYDILLLKMLRRLVPHSIPCSDSGWANSVNSIRRKQFQMIWLTTY